MMEWETANFRALAAFAPYLINGDASSLTEDERVRVDRFMDQLYEDIREDYPECEIGHLSSDPEKDDLGVLPKMCAITWLGGHIYRYHIHYRRP